MIELDKIKPSIIEEMKKIWFTADLHHGHTKIVEICNRPVSIAKSDLEHLVDKTPVNPEYKNLLNITHNRWLVDIINLYVGKNHTLFILGDVSMAKKQDAERFLDKLNGNKFLIVGNHDKNVDNSTRFKQITIRKDFNFSREGLNIHIVLDHFPLASWNRKVHGSWHLYGHVHGRFKNSGLSMDVGIDNSEIGEFTGGIQRPLNLYEIAQIMNKKISLGIINKEPL